MLEPQPSPLDPRVEQRGGAFFRIALGCAVLNWCVTGLGVLGCGGVYWYYSSGETRAQVFDRYRGRFAERRLQFARIAQQLPPAGSVSENRCRPNLDPKPLYDAKNKTFNTEVLMIDQLADPEVDPRRKNEFDLMLSQGLLRGLRWTGPKNPMSGDTRLKRDSTLPQDLEAALQVRYLLVVRTLRYPPLADFVQNAATADFEGYLVDLNSEEVLGTIKFSARARPIVARIEEAQSTLWEDACANLAKVFRETTGGNFVLER